jgi:hypothetical protein
MGTNHGHHRGDLLTVRGEVQMTVDSVVDGLLLDLEAGR